MNITNVSNLLYGCNGEAKVKSDSTVMVIVMLLITSISIAGNIMVIASIYKYRRLRNVTNYLLCSLAVSDLLSPLSRLTFIVIANLSERWIFGCVWCTITSQLGIFFCAGSIFHLCAITLERFLSISHPYKHELFLTKRRIVYFIFFIWFSSSIMAVLPFIFKSQIQLRFDQHILYCEIFLVEHPYLSLILLATYFLIPFIIMLFAYYNIFCETLSQVRRMRAESIGSRVSKQRRTAKQELKAVKTVLVVIGLFFILWLPYFSTVVIKSYNPNLPSWVRKFALCCAYLNSCTNWIVYNVMNKQMRRAFSTLLHLKRETNVTKKSRARSMSLRSISAQRSRRISPIITAANGNTGNERCKSIDTCEVANKEENSHCDEAKRNMQNEKMVSNLLHVNDRLGITLHTFSTESDAGSSSLNDGAVEILPTTN